MNLLDRSRCGLLSVRLVFVIGKLCHGHVVVNRYITMVVVFEILHRQVRSERRLRN